MTTPRKERRCPACRQAFQSSDALPFCSAPCKVADLSRWLGGAYRIDAEPVDDKDLAKGLETEPWG